MQTFWPNVLYVDHDFADPMLEEFADSHTVSQTVSCLLAECMTTPLMSDATNDEALSNPFYTCTYAPLTQLPIPINIQ